MSILVLAEHDNAALGAATLNAVTAAGQMGDDIHVLVAGSGCGAVAEAAAKVAGVAKVRVADAAHYANGLAEPVSDLLVSLAGDYSHIVAGATKSGKNILPRAAALLDVSAITDITAGALAVLLVAILV